MEASAETPVEQITDRVARLAVVNSQLPLSAEERTWIYAELSRIPEFVQSTTRIRGQDVSWLLLYDSGIEIYRRIHQRRIGIDPIWSQSASETHLQVPGVQVRDLASYIYRESILLNIRIAIRNWLQTGSPQGSLPLPFETLARSLLTEVEWAEIPAPATLQRRREQWIRSLELRDGTWYQGVLKIRVGDRLYGAAHRDGDPIGSEVDGLGVDWRRIAIDFDYSTHPGLEAQVERALRSIAEELQRRRERLAGPTAVATREANDRFDVQRGLLVPDCAQWTYSELEFWARYAARNTTSRVIYDWLQQYGPSFDVHFTLEVAPEEVDVSSFEEVADDLVRVASKRVLCALLATSGLGAPVYGRESFLWYDVELLPGYLDEVTVSRLEQEIRDRSISPVDPRYLLHTWGDVGPGEGDVEVSRDRDRSTLLVAVAIDLYRKRISPLVGRFHLRVYTLAPGSVEKVTPTHRTRMAVVGLSGRTLITPVPRSELLLNVPPMRLLVERGDLLLLSGDSSNVLLRTDEEPSQVLEILYSLQV